MLQIALSPLWHHKLQSSTLLTFLFTVGKIVTALLLAWELCSVLTHHPFLRDWLSPRRALASVVFPSTDDLASDNTMHSVYFPHRRCMMSHVVPVILGGLAHVAAVQARRVADLRLLSPAVCAFWASGSMRYTPLQAPTEITSTAVARCPGVHVQRRRHTAMHVQ